MREESVAWPTVAEVVQDIGPELDAIFARYPERRSALMPILHLLQDRLGNLPPSVLEAVADLLEVDPTEVISVASFYHLYFQEPVGRNVLLLCDDLPCSLKGAEAIIRHVEERLGVPCGEPTKDGLFTAIRSPCIAACHRPPAMQVNLAYHEAMTRERVDELIDSIRSQAREAV